MTKYFGKIGKEEMTVEVEDMKSRARKLASGGGEKGVHVGEAILEAQMPGKIVSVKVKVGDEVVLGQGVVVVEAMKMENEMTSPKDGVVKLVAVKEGQSVESGTKLVVIE